MSLAPTESLPSTGLDLFLLCAHTSMGRGFANALLRVKFDAVTSTKINANSHVSGDSVANNLGEDDILTYAEMMEGREQKRQRMNDYDENRAGLGVVDGRGLGGRAVKESLAARHVRIGSEFKAGSVGQGVDDGKGMKIRVDYLCILLSMRDKATLALARSCLRKIHREYITLRKVCVVVTDFNVSKSEYAFPPEELEKLLMIKSAGEKDKIFCVRSDFGGGEEEARKKGEGEGEEGEDSGEEDGGEGGGGGAGGGNANSAMFQAAEMVLRGAQQAGRKGKRGGISPLFFTTL
ncbi:hypothetical protein TrVE_jg7978 [Triparma verrucosa]|uniref:Uncharacterized protein n=1 Tax=Triparma verrucosa TaxID=1606542 RepID=A0A9W7ER69_9STRA|nr:hypothetical protein TrVE_jg7978 [Triparma verrucosa]